MRQAFEMPQTPQGARRCNGMKLVNIGFGNMINSGRLISIVSPESAPIKRVIREAEDKQMLINATY